LKDVKTKNQSDLPVEGIMRVGQWPDTDVYRVACSCSDPDHDVVTWIEVQPESDIREVAITFFVNTRSPDWRKGWNRWRAAWNLLWHGCHESEHTLLLTREAGMNLSSAILASVQRLEKPSNGIDSPDKTP
jgi:hypothetical protein